MYSQYMPSHCVLGLLRKTLPFWNLRRATDSPICAAEPIEGIVAGPIACLFNFYGLPAHHRLAMCLTSAGTKMRYAGRTRPGTTGYYRVIAGISRVFKTRQVVAAGTGPRYTASTHLSVNVNCRFLLSARLRPPTMAQYRVPVHPSAV